MVAQRTTRQIGQPWVLVTLVVGLLAVSALLTYLAGGTRTPIPHAFYVPIVLAAGACGIRIGLATAVTAGLLCGPFMPIDVQSNLSQTTSSWLTRLAFFALIAVVVGVGRRRLLELSQARQNFLSVVSHELRTPLASVMGFASLLANRDLDFSLDEQSEFADVILKEANELSAVVDHYIIEGRLSDSALFIDARPTDLRKIVDIVLGGLPAQIRDKRIEVAGDEIVCIADPLRLRQILRFVFNNALAYTKNSISIDVTTKGTHALVTVSDRDTTAPPQRRLSPWTQTAQNGDGTLFAPLGLGLTVSRDLAKRMGGNLTYEVNGTTNFELRLPLDNSHKRNRQFAG